MLPKVHKPNNPGRPIVSACEGPTERISEYIDYYTTSTKGRIIHKGYKWFLVKTTQLRPDSKPFIFSYNWYNSTIYIHSWPGRHQGIKRSSYHEQNQEPKTWLLLRLMLFILKNTSFQFNGEFYKQISGTIYGEKNSSGVVIKAIKQLGKQKYLSVTPFRGRTYIHVSDVQRNKCVSFSINEFHQLLANMKGAVQEYHNKFYPSVSFFHL